MAGPLRTLRLVPGPRSDAQRYLHDTRGKNISFFGEESLVGLSSQVLSSALKIPEGLALRVFAKEGSESPQDAPDRPSPLCPALLTSARVSLWEGYFLFFTVSPWNPVLNV